MMRNMPPQDDSSEQEKSPTRKIDTKHYTPGNSTEQLMLDYLLESGFQWDEAVILLNMREHIYENAEMRQRLSEDYRMHFAKWLYDQGLVSDT
jgi:hypothetical protein